MDAAFGSVRMVVSFLENTLVAYQEDVSVESNLTAGQIVYYLCQQCEASLQFLQSLCQQKLFKERLLKNKVSNLTIFINIERKICVYIYIYIYIYIYMMEFV